MDPRLRGDREGRTAAAAVLSAQRVAAHARHMGAASRRLRGRGRDRHRRRNAGRDARTRAGHARGGHADRAWRTALVTFWLPPPRTAAGDPLRTFERRIPLPHGRLEIGSPELAQGCLTLRLRKIDEGQP